MTTIEQYIDKIHKLSDGQLMTAYKKFLLIKKPTTTDKILMDVAETELKVRGWL